MYELAFKLRQDTFSSARGREKEKKMGSNVINLYKGHRGERKL